MFKIEWHLKDILLFGIVVFIGMSWSFPALADAHKFSSWPEACSTAEKVVAEGDIIFLDSPNFLFREVAASTNSWTSHVGIVFKSNGKWIVSESTIPLSKDSGLCDFLEKSANYRFEIKRLNRSLEPFEIVKMRKTAISLLGEFYTLGFNFDSKKLFCSKLGYLTYKSVNIEVGKIQSFRQLLSEMPTHSLDFWKLALEQHHV